MIVVIQCAARKRGDAGFLRTKDGRKVLVEVERSASPPRSQGTWAAMAFIAFPAAALSFMLLIVCMIGAIVVIFKTDFFEAAGVKQK